MSNFDADVKKTTARFQCENSFGDRCPLGGQLCGQLITHAVVRRALMDGMHVISPPDQIYTQKSIVLHWVRHGLRSCVSQIQQVLQRKTYLQKTMHGVQKIKGFHTGRFY